MYAMESKYYPDLGPLAQLTLQEFFDRVRMIPYRRDPKGQEITARPEILLGDLPALDCKKKAILMGAYCKANGIPHRFIACSQRPDRKIHHVFTQAMIKDNWRNVDPTYAKYRLFEPKKLTRAEVLPRDSMKETPMNIERMGAELIQMQGDPIMGFSIGKMLRQTKDAVGSTARAVQSNILRPATGLAMTAVRSGALNSLVPGAGLALQALRSGGDGGGSASPGQTPRYGASNPMRRAGGINFGRGRASAPAPAPVAETSAAAPDNKMLYIGGGVAALGLLLAIGMMSGKKNGG